MKERIHWIDVLKGILIVFVVIHHAPFNVKADFPLWGYKWWNSFIIGFFMPAFFVVTGYCTNFNSPFRSFIWKNIKTILIPCFCLYYFNHWIQDCKVYFFEDADWVTWSHFFSPGIRTFIREGGYYWFLSALFLAKIVFYGINRLSPKLFYQMAISLLLMFVGVICAKDDNICNFFYWQQAIVLVVYFQIGKLLKRYVDLIDKFGYLFLLTYIMVICAFVLLGKDIPSVTRTIDVTIYTIPLQVLLSLLGTFAIWWLSIKIDNNTILEYWGRNTIVIYAFNFSTLGITFSALSYLYTPHGVFMYNIFFWSIVVLSLIALTFLAYIFNTRYLKYLLGKY